MAPEAYVAPLGQRLERQPATGRIVLFSADDEAGDGLLVHAFDGAKQAGARALGMITDAPVAGSAIAPAPSRQPRLGDVRLLVRTRNAVRSAPCWRSERRRSFHL